MASDGLCLPSGGSSGSNKAGIKDRVRVRDFTPGHRHAEHQPLPLCPAPLRWLPDVPTPFPSSHLAQVPGGTLSHTFRCLWACPTQRDRGLKLPEGRARLRDGPWPGAGLTQGAGGALLRRMGVGDPSQVFWNHLLPSVSLFPSDRSWPGGPSSCVRWVSAHVPLCPLRCPLPALVLGRQLRPLGSQQPPSPLPGGLASPEVTCPGG